MSEATQTERPQPTLEEFKDLEVLSAFDSEGFLRPPVAFPPTNIAAAMKRGHINGWFQLVDIEPHPTAQGNLLRVFKITPAGWARLYELKKKVEQ